MIYLGDKKAESIYLGDKKLSKIYLGERLVWEGYPEGHIIGTATNPGDTVTAYRYYTNSTIVNLSCIADNNKRFDLPVPTLIGDGSIFFYSNSYVATVDSFKALFENTSDNELCFCSELKKVNLNGIKFTNSDLSMYGWLNGCKKLQYIDAKGVEWSKIESIDHSFRDLPSLVELDLSGANLSQAAILDCFSKIGSVGTIVKVIGCSATTQNKILNALNANNGQTWVLKDGVITRTA